MDREGVNEEFQHPVSGGGGDHAIEVAGADMAFRRVLIRHHEATGRGIAHAAGLKPPDSAIVLRLRVDGPPHEIGPDEAVDLARGDRRFVAVVGDRLFLFDVGGRRFEWPVGWVTGVLLRLLAHVPEDRIVCRGTPDDRQVPVGDDERIDLTGGSIEQFSIRKREWRLNVHGVVIVVPTPTVVVRTAMQDAGFDPAKPWFIWFQVAGQPKRAVGLDDVLDLETPGIEKLRLFPRNVDNGEAAAPPIFAFALLEADVAYLDRLGLRWETLVEANRRWLVIHDYPVPTAYAATHAMLALEIPPPYPAAAIYGFYAYPPLRLTSGREIPNTQLRGVLLGREFHGWSRYRAGAPWDPAVDNVVTQISLVEAALAKEAGE
jgi:hypothetical protein